MAKKKIKKFLKKVAPLVVAGLGAAALGKRARRKAMIEGADANEGFGFMTMKDYGPYSKRNVNAARNFRFNPTMMLSGVGDDPVYGTEYQAGAKKGGRIVKTKKGGKALRGYGRAYMKGRK